MDHKQWLDNEYSLWIKALQESTVHNFKEHPGVKRMIDPKNVARKFWSDCDVLLYSVTDVSDLIIKIDSIGYKAYVPFSDACVRMVWYAREVLKRNPSGIIEIGGGVGQFYAILRAMGYKGEYLILDLPEVKKFQDKYLREVSRQTGLMLDLWEWEGEGHVYNYDTLISFYALGEFDNEMKQQLGGFIDKSPHGYIAFNPHSGASDSLSIFENHDIKVNPGIEPDIQIIEW